MEVANFYFIFGKRDAEIEASRKSSGSSPTRVAPLQQALTPLSLLLC